MDALAGKPAREYIPEFGQNLYAVNAIEPAAAVVDALERDYRAAIARNFVNARRPAAC